MLHLKEEELTIRVALERDVNISTGWQKQSGIVWYSLLQKQLLQNRWRDVFRQHRPWVARGVGAFRSTIMVM